MVYFAQRMARFGRRALLWFLPQQNLIGEEKWESILTKKRDYIQFAPADGGKTCYMAAQVENKRKKGPWGPMINKTIPG